MWTDDPIADFARHDAEQQEELEKLPVCSECGEPIQSEYCYEIDGEYICEECLECNHKKTVDSIID
jgi:formylmethanofuran dehydrogenase subunit E